MLDRLEASGLVERRRDPQDRRAWQIFLTDQAQPLIEQLYDLATKVTDQALAALSAEERQQLSALLLKVRETLTTQGHPSSEAAHG
jgi:DNA-binding MarR family transcriptional regulator